ncbi:MAG: metalloregulator ArsR/SmtB family transcription factor [Thermococci archaeon]|nr:metalloregulator ArsR/SmtB family transcription factor [Thermococci archaeon]
MKRREEIFEVIKRRPGVTFREITRELDVGVGTLQYHLRILEEEGRVFSKRIGGRRYLFPCEMRERAQRILMAISTENRRKVLLALLDGPLTQTKITKKTGMSQPSVSYHLKSLVELGVVQEKRVGRKRIYRVVYDPAMLARMIKEYRPGLWDKMAEKLADLIADMEGAE